MAPILCLLRSMVERGITRKATYYYGARRRQDLCFEEELRALEEMLPGFRYVPGAVRADDEDAWDGEVGFITDVVRGTRATSRTSTRTSAVRHRWWRRPWRCSTELGAPEKRIYYDKFTHHRIDP